MKMQATELMIKAQRKLAKQHGIADRNLLYIGNMDRRPIEKADLMMFIIDDRTSPKYRTTVSISKEEVTNV